MRKFHYVGVVMSLCAAGIGTRMPNDGISLSEGREMPSLMDSSNRVATWIHNNFCYARYARKGCQHCLR